MPSPSSLHLAIIPDGNRRWAKEHLLQPWKGHETATDIFHTLTEWCRSDARVGVLTVWCFSTENWKRDPKEISMLMDMLEKYLTKERRSFIERKTRFVHSGRTDRTPPSLAKLMKEVSEETKGQTGFTLHLALDYGGKDEVIRAVRRLKDSSAATDESIRAHLDHPELPDIDMIIRTSGEQRTSNFFLWQSTYAEWFFLDKFFPDVTVEDLDTALREFERRKRRFGS